MMNPGINVETLLSPEMADALDQERKLSDEVDVSALDKVTARRTQYNHGRHWWNQGGPVMQETRNFTVLNGTHEIPCRLHIPDGGDGLSPVIVFCHGGGWVVGGLDTHDRIMRELAIRTGCRVLGVDYRLAPEHRFPAPHQDAMAVLNYIIDSGPSLGLDSRRIAFAGDSAGAHMCLWTAQQLRDQGRIDRLRGLALVYGSYGMVDSTSRRIYGGGESGLSAEDMRFYISSLMGPDQTPVSSGFDLLRQSLEDLPPSLVMACELDPLRDDSIVLNTLLKQAGVSSKLDVVDGVLHGYLHFGEMVTESRESLQRCADFLSPLLKA